MSISITEKFLTSLIKEPLAKDKSFTDTSGLVVIARPSTKVSNNTIFFKTRKIIDGKKSFVTLGKFPKLSIAQARKLHYETLEKIQNGEPLVQEPVVEVKYSFKDLWQKFIALQQTKITENTLEKYYSSYRCHLYKLDNVDIRELTPKYLLKFFEPLVNNGEYGTVQRLANMIKLVVDYAVFLQIVEFNPILNISKFLPKPNYQHFKSFSDLTLEQDLVQLFKDISVLNKDIQCLIYMYFFTLLRSVELRSVKLQDISNGLLDVKTKTLSSFRVPLSSQAQRIVDYLLAKRPTTVSEYLFLGRAGGLVSENTVNKALDRLGYKDKLRVHGIRTVGRMYLQTIPDIKESIIELCLSHTVVGKVAQAYNRGEYLEERKRALQVFSDFIVKCAKENFEHLFIS